MGITTTQFIRKPLYVDAVRITGANFDEIATWCQGEVLSDEVPGKGTTKRYIKVRVHNPKNARQTKAFVGDWILYTERGYKVYTNKAFRASFDNVAEIEAREQEILARPTPATPEAVQLEAQRNAGLIAQGGDVYDDTIDLVPANPHLGKTVDENQARQELGLPAIEQAEELEVYTDSAYPETHTIGGTPREEINVGAPSGEQPENVDTVVEQEKIDPTAAEGKRVLSIEEQKELSAEEVRELVQSGEVVLAQDIAAA